MTVPIAAEAIGGLVGGGGGGAAAAGAEAGAGGAAVRSTAARRSVTQRTGVKPTNPKTPATKPPASGRTGKGSTSSSSTSDRHQVRFGKDRGRSLSIPKFGGVKGGGAAHKLVIAEFVLCIVLIGIAPILVRPPAPDGSGRNHLYLANDFVRLSATCLLFFILALLANQPRSARFAAAFGGLVVLGAAFNANKAFIALTGIFTTPKATP